MQYLDIQERYQRNVLVEGIGIEGQAKLSASKVLVIGAGGLGSPVLFYLAAAGVGTIGIVDDDVVNRTNLQRQILHFTNDIGRRKINSAEQKIAALNPDVEIITYQYRFTEQNAQKIIDGSFESDNEYKEQQNTCINPYCEGKNLAGGYDFVVDCCDNYATKLLINDVCVQMGKPFSHGAVVAMRGEVMTYVPGSACYRCVFDAPPQDGLLPTSSQVGILGAVAGIVGSIQATETIKYISGMNDLIVNRIMIIDTKAMNFFSLKVKKSNACICG